MAANATSFLIIGGGIAGLSTAWHLARAGHGSRTKLVESEPHLSMHSSGLNAAILRTLSHDPISTRIALQSARFLREPPPDFSPTPLVDAFGLMLVAGEDRADEIAGWVKAARGEGAVSESISSTRLSARAPHFMGEHAAAWWFEEEGRIDIGALVAGFVRGAQKGGVQIRRSCRVAGLIRRGGRILGARLESGEEVRADITVLAAGGWAARLGAAAGSRVRLRPTRRHLMVTATHPAVDRRWPVVWYFGSPTEGEFYCRPEGGGMLLCACETVDVDPDHFDVENEVQRSIVAKTTRHLPALQDARVAHFWCGMRTLTRDGRFAIGSDPQLEGLFWVAGLGGSGMVCSAEVGRLASAELLSATSDREIMDALRPARLAVS